MKIDGIDLGYVVIDSPCECLDSEEAKYWFAEALNLRFKGYAAKYAKGALPADIGDFFGTHILIIDQNSKKVLTSYKFVTLDQTELYRKTFPPFATLEESSAFEHFEAAKKIVETAKKDGVLLAYVNTWAMDPNLEQNHKLRQVLRNMIAASHFFYQSHYKINEVLVFGATRMHADKYQEKFGYRRVPDKYGNILPEFSQKSLLGEKAVMLHLTNPSEWYIENAKPFETDWLLRKTIESNELENHLNVA